MVGFTTQNARQLVSVVGPGLEMRLCLCLALLACTGAVQPECSPGATCSAASQPPRALLVTVPITTDTGSATTIDLYEGDDVDEAARAFYRNYGGESAQQSHVAALSRGLKGEYQRAMAESAPPRR